jgi:Flp pilus assembly protein TadG
MNPSSAFNPPLARLAGALRRWRAARGGAAAVEFAAIAPFVLALFVPLADFGAYVYDNMQLQLAAQAGAEYAARHEWSPTGIENAILTAAPSLNLSMTDANVPNSNDVLPSPFDPAHVQFCGCASGTSITQVACSNPRPTCANGLQSGVYYSVGAQTVYHTISGFSYPFLANSQLLTATSTVRVQ